jgi:gluconokinase
MTVLVIDVGSSSVRALLLDEDATPISGAIARRDHQLDTTTDAAHLRDLVEGCIDDVLHYPEAATVKAVGMATFVSNLLGLSADDKPLTPLYTYADTVSTAAAQSLAAKHDMVTVHHRTGCRIHAAYHPAKLHRLRWEEPERFNAVVLWLDFATYCYRQWFGRDVPCSYSVASWSGLLNHHYLMWDTEWLNALDLAPQTLPPLADFNETQRGLSPHYTERWPILKDIPFFLAVGDGAAANVGSGGVSVAHPVLTVGTTAAIRVITESPPAIPPGLWAYYVDARHRLIGGATSEGGNVFAWARRTLKFDIDHAERIIQERRPGAHGVIALPFFAGERSPLYRQDATASLHGLTLATTPVDILHALLEAVALRLRLIYDEMGRPGDYILAGGGGLNGSPVWPQIMADILGVSLRLVDVAEPTARGVALLMHPDWPRQPAPPGGQQITPRSAYRADVEALLARHRQYDRF